MATKIDSKRKDAASAASRAGAEDDGRLIPAPSCLLKPFKAAYRAKVLLGPGPSNVPHRVATAASGPMVSHSDPIFYELMEELKLGIQFVFQTRNKNTFCITGSGHAGMEAAVANTLDGKEDVFLVAVHGLWGERAAAMGTRIAGATVVRLSPSRLGEIIGLDKFEEALAKHRPKLLYVCHGDSTSGTLQPLEGLGKLCHRHGCLLMVDGVASLLAAPLPMDNLEIDILFSGSQKCLNAPPGLALISLSERAMTVIKRRKTPARAFYLDIMKIAANWGCVEANKYVYHSTPAVSLLMALREALAIVAEAGSPETIIRQQNELSAYVQRQLQEQLGLEFLVRDPRHRLPSVLAVKVPKGVDAQRVRSFLADNYAIEIAGGLGPGAPEMWRIGLMGLNASRFNCDSLLAALKAALQAERSKL